MEVTAGVIRGSYEELVDAAEDLGDILSAATNLLDLTPALQRWLVGQLEEVELALARELDTYGREPEGAPQVRKRRLQERGAA